MALDTPCIGSTLTRSPLVLLCLCMMLASSRAAHAQVDQQAVRAAYIFNLSKYVSWPHSMKDLKICSEADERTGRLLKEILEGKNSEGRMVHIVLAPSVAEQRECAILYLGRASAVRVAAVLQELGTSPVLTVSEDPQFVRQGGMVALVRAEDQIQLHVNIGALHSAGIQMSSRLLSIAVVDRAGGRN
jgi:hypothetical protein